MDYQYIAYNADRKLIKGKFSASSEEAALGILSYGNYQVVSLKKATPVLNLQKLLVKQIRVNPKETIMFSRQLALLLGSGIDIVTALELLQNQVINTALKDAIGEIISDIRGGTSLSEALSKHPKIFSQVYYQAVAAGEQSGSLELVLRQMADHIERAYETAKRVKGALTYPILVLVVALLVIAAMVIFVLPTFTSLYASIGAEMPGLTNMLLGAAGWFSHNGLYLILVLVVLLGLGFVYAKGAHGKALWDRAALRLPVVGRIYLLNEMARACRTIALLFKVGLPLPEIMTMASQGSSNGVVSGTLVEVQRELIRGEGLSRPMSKMPIFPPLMVQMVAVGEETGNLDTTLTTVAESFEAESADKTAAAVGLIQPAVTIVIGLIIMVIAVTLMSAIYSIYGQMDF